MAPTAGTRAGSGGAAVHRDAGWLLIERREQPMHVGGLLLFRPQPDAPRTFMRDLATRLREPTEVQ